MPCRNCGKAAMFGIGPDGKVPICLDCYIKFWQVMEQQLDLLEREYNMLAQRAENTLGIPGLIPRYPPKPPRVVLTEGTTLNNINVSGGNIGVLNTGTLGTIDAAIGAIHGAGDSERSAAFKTLTEAVVNSGDLPATTKSEVLEILSLLASEGVAPREKRRTRLMKRLLQEVSSLLSTSVALTQLWEKVKPMIESLF